MVEDNYWDAAKAHVARRCPGSDPLAASRKPVLRCVVGEMRGLTVLGDMAPLRRPLTPTFRDNNAGI
jgi:hypothetical protein